MYKVIVFDVNATQENPIKPIELVVDADALSKCIIDHLNDHTFCNVAPVEIYR